LSQSEQIFFINAIVWLMTSLHHPLLPDDVVVCKHGLSCPVNVDFPMYIQWPNNLHTRLRFLTSWESWHLVILIFGFRNCWIILVLSIFGFRISFLDLGICKNFKIDHWWYENSEFRKFDII